MSKVFKQEVDTKEQRPGGPLLITLLFKQSVDLPEIQRIAEVCRKHIGNVECRKDDDKSLFIFALDHIAKFQDGEAPVQLLLTSCTNFDGRRLMISQEARCGTAKKVMIGFLKNVGTVCSQPTFLPAVCFRWSGLI